MTDINQLRGQSLYQIFHIGAQSRRAEISAALVQALGLNVLTGPFAGMTLPNEASWGDGDLPPKLLGCYEAELHPAIAKAISRDPQVVVNIGCAEGYYAVGMARALPQARVLAFDADAKAQAICARAAAANQVVDRVKVEGACGAETLLRLTSEPARMLLIVDCEGAELPLLDPVQVPQLGRCDMIIECHDFVNPSITGAMQARFGGSHDVENIVEGPRDPNQFTWLRRMQSLDRWLAVNENRPTTMNWLVCWARR